MRNRNKAILKAVRILQVTPSKFCRVFGSDRVDEEAQQEKNAPLRDGKAHGHIPSAWNHLNRSSYARIQPTPGARALRRGQTVRSHAFLLLYARFPSLEHSGSRTNRLRIETGNCDKTETRSNTKVCLCSTITHRPVGTPQFMRASRPARASWGQRKNRTTATSCGQIRISL